ncbi:DsrE family protein [Puniceicoccaceae bacterium K14]|nr:DsrE family protein [Puniceicoccaceae bacterium K14]
MKTAIIIYSDPLSGSNEALTRMLNALAVADECRREGDELAIGFMGTGTRWPAELAKLSHPANGLFNELREFVVGASRACAKRNEATEGLKEIGVDLIDDNKVEGTIGILSIRRYLAEGWNVLQF